MSKFSFKRAAAAAALALGAVGSAQALSITAGDFVIIFKNYDAGTTGYQPLPGAPYPSVSTLCATVAACDAAIKTQAPGSGATGIDTMGIVSVESIRRISDNFLWYQAGRPGDNFLTGVFTGLRDHTVTAACFSATNCSLQTSSVGGTFALYENLADYNPTLGPNGAGVNLPAGQYAGITDTGSLFLSGVFTTGVNVGDFTSTYQSNFNAFSFAGGGQAFIDVTGGSAQVAFDTNSLTDTNGTKRDLFLDVTFNDVNNAASSIGWTVTSAGQIKGNAIPEPGTLALVALAALGLGAASRRRKA